MIPIVETQSEILDLIKEVKDNRIFVAPILKDPFLHYTVNTLSLLYLYDLTLNKECIVSFNHSEALSINESLLKDLLCSSKECFVLNLKYLLSKVDCANIYDANMVIYFLTNKSIDVEEFDTSVHDYFNQKYSNLKNLNHLIPIVKHHEKFGDLIREYKDQFKTFTINETFLKYNNVIKTLHHIEFNGMYVDDNILKESFPHVTITDNFVYTEYNPYTTTGRPSNRFDSVNYAALNKETGVRKAFKSRFGKDGFLLQFDYDAYHIRLLGELLGYQFPGKINMHEYLGRQYFGKEELSPEEYEQSKSITFKLLYGGIEKEFLEIPFFKLVDDFTKTNWKLYKEQKYLETPIFKRTLKNTFFSEMNSQKLLNYLIQSLEMEETMAILDTLTSFNKGYKSKIILYTYDSILIDFHKDDGGKYIKQCQKILECNGKYPVKVQAGYDYQLLKNVTV
jgi:hypothetical protein